MFDRRMGQGWVATSTFVSTVIKLKCNYCGKLFHSHELTHMCVIHIVHISGREEPTNGRDHLVGQLTSIAVAATKSKVVVDVVFQGEM